MPTRRGPLTFAFLLSLALVAPAYAKSKHPSKRHLTPRARHLAGSGNDLRPHHSGPTTRTYRKPRSTGKKPDSAKKKGP